MANPATPITTALNREFKGRCPRIQAGCAGSFLSIRIEDPDGIVSVKLAREVTRFAHDLWIKAGVMQQMVPTACYHMDGVVACWTRH